MTKQLLSFLVFLTFGVVSAQCDQPSNLSISNITNTSAVFSWTEVNPTASTEWEVLVLPAGTPEPTVADVGMLSTANPYVVTGLVCGSVYKSYVRSICSAGSFSLWTGPFYFQTPCTSQLGSPITFRQCSDGEPTCFNISVNTPAVLGALNPSDYTVTYHTSESEANSDVNAIPNTTAYCISNSEVVYMRVEENATGTFEIRAFETIVSSAIQESTLQPLAQCDEDGNGIVTFDLTTAAAQINTTNPLSYFADIDNAMANTNPIANPTAYNIPTTVNLFISVFVRESVTGSCDIVYALPVNSLVNCNSASFCSGANSLCGSLGIPFSNTVGLPGAESGNDYDCLTTTPNPTWFYIPISQGGDLQFSISQVWADGTGLDVDFICYGPFANPVTPCSGELVGGNKIACSYSTNFVEEFTIPNTLPGQFYLLMVTNFSGMSGQITINKIGGTGEIDCTGMQFTAFLDSNSNGTKDSGELNFPLGDFHYTKNGGTVHNITSSTGVYSIYDISAANSYNVNYTIDPAYAANYTVSPSSFTGLNVVAGSGLTEYFFPVTAIQNYNDLGVTTVATSQPRPGFTYTNLVRYTNYGNQTISGTVTYNHDPLVTMTDVTQSGITNITNGFTYDFTGLLPFESREILITLQVPLIPTVNINDWLTSTASIVPLSGDVLPENNEFSSTQIVIGSYDPNDKMESHGERIVFADFNSSDFLYYTIRFENTGTANAEIVKILDVLDDALDATSVRMIDASHNYVLDRVNNQLTWRFEDINLPFASADAEGAKGYVHFKVKPKPGYAIGDVIPNTASIYFDFNPAIVTNTFHTQFVENLGIPSFEDGGFVLYPNPAGDFVTISLSQNTGSISSIAIYDMLGKKVAEKQSGATSETIDVSGIGSGIYLLEVINSDNQKAIRKLSIR